MPSHDLEWGLEYECQANKNNTKDGGRGEKGGGGGGGEESTMADLHMSLT